MKRREFITLFGGAAAAWPLAAQAQQQPDRVRRIGVLQAIDESDPEAQLRKAAFVRRLQELGWTDGRNVRIDYRSAVGDDDRARRYATELVALAPDVVLASGASIVSALQRATRTVPIVFVNVIDPVGAGFVDSLSRPGGNATGFTNFEYGLSGKWLELLKEFAPGLTRVAILRDPASPVAGGQLGAIQVVAPSFGVEVSPLGVRDAPEIERAITAFALEANGGLVVTGSPAGLRHRDLIITLAARHRLPAVYSNRVYVTAGGLASYGADTLGHFLSAAGYVDRILKGERPADLAVQNPTKYELIVNLQTAKALGLEVPPTLLARADEVIE
jgi:putative tryptophan/tyrosine transport system substrate-binding protein